LEEELKISATTDKLTQAYNRTKYDEIIAGEFERADRYQQLLSIVLLDIDNFKEVNDRYGHLVGDTVLRTLADIVRKNKRGVDHFIRWGGEEFMIVASGTGLEGAKVLAERLRKAIESYKIDTVGKITVSLGVTQFRQGDTEESLIKRADDALYEAKRAGKNQVVIGT
jgi:diguanylate cyclase (GGDEF)-like protein